MKKLAFILGLILSIFSQSAWSIKSISDKLVASEAAGNTRMKNAGKTIVLCVCEELFPALQEILEQSKPELKDVFKAYFTSVGFSKQHLTLIKEMTVESVPLVNEGVCLYAHLIKKHGKSAVQTMASIITQVASTINASAGLEVGVDNLLDGLCSLADKAELDKIEQFNQKVDQFYAKWASAFEFIGSAIEASSLNKNQSTKKSEDAIGKLITQAAEQKRVERMQMSVLPVLSLVRTQDDGIRLIQACLSELEANVCPLTDSAEKCLMVSVPLLASVVIQAVDETLNNLLV
jgi:hypothetical protein